MTTVYLVRHGEAEGNIYRRCHGHYDSLLTPRGYKQLECLVQRFKDVKIDQFYASDLFRAYNTAKAIADSKGMTVHTDPAFREINMGIWEDKTWAELPLNYPEDFEQWTKQPWKFSVEKSETILQASNRMYDAICKVVEHTPDSTILIASHGLAIRGMLCKVLGLENERIQEIGWADNTAVSKLIFDGQNITVEYYNDSEHLPKELSTFGAIRWLKDEEIPRSMQLWFRNVSVENDLDIIKPYQSKVEELIARDKSSVAVGMMVDEPVSMVMLDHISDNEIFGSIIDIRIKDQYLGLGFAPQLLGYAVSIFRNQGKQVIKTRVPSDNKRAISFFEKYGFNRTNVIENDILMEKNIVVK